DLLGLKNQSLLELAVNLINSRHNIELDIDNIPMDDEDTFKMIQSGRTVGTFQLASPGMRSLMREMMPNKFEDIIALIALYRPGPLKSNMDKVFVEQKHGRRTVRYPHETLAEILEETYGVIVYQEQAMEIAKVLAGYTGLEADELRKAIAKKKPEIMQEHREKFVSGAKGRGIDERTADGIFELIDKFGGYGFNKSHSTAYAYVSYQTAYLKTHYPPEYMAALMTTYMDNQDRLVEYLNETRRMGIGVKPPDINLSDSHFTPYDEHVLFGLSAVRNVGSGVVEQIITCREPGGPFKSFLNFCERVPSSATNKKTVESLIRAGAFDSIEPDRSLLLATYDNAVSTAQRKRREAEEGQFALFEEQSAVDSSLNGEIPAGYQEIPGRELLQYEKEMLGAYVSDHPLSEWREPLYRQSDLEVAQITDDMNRAPLTIGGMLTGLEKRYNKAGKPWASFVLEDFSGSIDVLVFSNKYENLEKFLREDAILLVKGRPDHRDNTRKFLADEIKPLLKGHARPGNISVRIATTRFSEDLVSHIKEILMQHPGGIPVHLSLWENGMETTTVKLGELYSVEAESDLIAKLKSLLGETAVTVEYRED
ncbi:MAG: DNA polymerase III subunit alpha, partial [Actinobacteria bacterium]|nr:DNA polymerase III subunit alpha [Actinomycetota bacterium]